MKVSLKLLVLTLSWPVSAVCSDIDWDLQPFFTLKSGYQWAQDDAYMQSDPSGGLWGISGGLQFSPEWSWDLGYRYQSNWANSTDVEVESWWIDSAIRYDWYLRNDLSLYGRVGAAYWDLEKSQSNRFTQTGSGTSPFAEVGLSYRFNDNINLSAGYEYADSIGSSETGRYNSHGLIFALSYQFGQIPQTAEKVVEEKFIPQVSPIEPVKPTQPEPAIEVAEVYTFSEITLGKDYSFESDSAYVGTAFEPALQTIASTLVSFPQASVIIVGHADATGTEAYNQELSERRASAVAAELLQLGVTREQMKLSGKGELEPVASNITAEGRAKNRRVEVTITSFNYQQ